MERRYNSPVQTLFVASAGGHLNELWALRSRFAGIEGDSTWVTFDTGQSREYLAREQRIFIPSAEPRDGLAVLRHSRLAMHILGLADWSMVVSTGCLPAVPFFVLARARGIECHFIESATRVQGPSLSASMLERVPGVHRYSQYRWPDRPRWHYRGSVLDGYRCEPGPPRPVRRAVVTVGTSRPFPRLLEATAAALPPEADVVWQTGDDAVGDLPGSVQAFLVQRDLEAVTAQADVVVCHAGVGSVLAAFAVGRCPVVMARQRAFDEHVDDHQIQLVRELVSRGLVLAVEPEELTADVLAEAAGRRIVAEECPPPFLLDGVGRTAARPRRLVLAAGIRPRGIGI